MSTYIFRVFLFLLVMGAAGPAKSQVADAKFDLYILMGQSNMAGRGLITPEIAAEHSDHVYVYTKDQHWVVAKHPLHFDKPLVAGVGPGLTFGIVMANAYNLKTGLIPCAVGGTPIAHWEPGTFDTRSNTHPYDDAIDRIKAAMKYGTIKGVIWHQGEGDSKPDNAKAYLEKLAVLIHRIREIVGNPNLPFVSGELGRYRDSYQQINKVLEQLPALVPYTAVASSEGLVDKGDSTHFDGHSAQEMGRRMAVQMLKLQAKKGR